MCLCSRNSRSRIWHVPARARIRVNRTPPSFRGTVYASAFVVLVLMVVFGPHLGG
jgi:hypothetical protein